jgi:hypothetical protein
VFVFCRASSSRGAAKRFAGCHSLCTR